MKDIIKALIYTILLIFISIVIALGLINIALLLGEKMMKIILIIFLFVLVFMAVYAMIKD